MWKESVSGETIFLCLAGIKMIILLAGYSKEKNCLTSFVKRLFFGSIKPAYDHIKIIQKLKKL